MEIKPVQVEAIDLSKKTSAIRGKDQQGTTALESGVCYWNGQPYSEGATICSTGNLLRCYSDGSWSVVGTC